MGTEAQNIELVKDLYAAFGRGDLPYILERFAPELESFGVSAGGSRKAPFHFRGQRREDVARYFEALLGAMQPITLEPLHYAAGGDYVYATLHHEYQVRKNGKKLVLHEGVHRFKVKNGKIVAWLAADDTELTNETLA